MQKSHVQNSVTKVRAKPRISRTYPKISPQNLPKWLQARRVMLLKSVFKEVTVKVIPDELQQLLVFAWSDLQVLVVTIIRKFVN